MSKPAECDGSGRSSIATTMDVPSLSAIPYARRWVADRSEGARAPSSRENVRVTFRFPAGAELAVTRYLLATS